MAHVYEAAGTYRVTLTVTDDDDLSDTAEHTIVVGEPVANQPPLAAINGPASASVGETVIFDSGIAGGLDILRALARSRATSGTLAIERYRN